MAAFSRLAGRQVVRLIPFLWVLLIAPGALAQVPALLWQKALGGTGDDRANAITASGDGGFVVAGYTYSNDGDVSGYQGGVTTG